MRVLVLIVLLFASGCFESRRSSSEPSCAPSFETCTSDSDCCTGNYCSGPYGPSTCTPVSPDGSFCTSERECASGTCVENVCGGRPATCVAAGAACTPDGGACCEGTSCRADESGAPRCLRPVPHVEPPPDPPAECMAAWEYDCTLSGRPCCAGLYCEPEGSYYAGHCIELVPDGEWCSLGFRRCASGRCEDSMCRSGSCVAIGAECPGGSHAECCTGFCDFGFSYGAGVCRERQPAGSLCYDNAWCLSGSCNPDRICD